jgi:hypothetical protein
LRGSVDAEGWPRTSNEPSHPPRPGSSSQIFACSPEGWQGHENTTFILIQTLTTYRPALAGYSFLYVHRLRSQRKALISRIVADMPVIVEVFSGGLRSPSELLSIEVPWPAVREIGPRKGRIEVECDAIVIYVSALGFADHEAFIAAEKTIRQAWRQALLQNGGQQSRADSGSIALDRPRCRNAPASSTLSASSCAGPWHPPTDPCVE